MEELKKRVASLLWRAGMLGLAVALDAVVQGLAGLEIPIGYVAILGLVLGELSKHLHNRANR